MDEPDLVCVHKARVAHHVAPVRQIHGQYRATAVLDGACPVVMNVPVVVGANITAREGLLQVP